MKKIIFALLLCLSAAGTSFAQNNMEAMRFLTINALMQYGQKLYDRGDFNEACSVFNHVLDYDGHQAQALQYLKDMGRLPAIRHVPILQAKAPQPVDIWDTQSLKKAIEIKKLKIEKLRTQIMQLRANIASQSET
ncbi:MAG: hypothetical protein HQL12_02855 [Candidatus Omnitrophica bacterium]|nr:hypothetical protein [Candidatus Omnitrophota bacterium]